MSDETAVKRPSEQIADRVDALLSAFGETSAPDADPRSGCGLIAICRYLDSEAARRAAWEKDVEVSLLNRTYPSELEALAVKVAGLEAYIRAGAVKDVGP